MKPEYPIEVVDLFITEQCNLNCSYCFHPKTAAVMTVEEGKRIIDRLKELYPNKMGLTFFGGEPTLYPETVLALAEYAVPLWDRCFLTLVTNGTYFDEKFFNRLKELNFTIQVSMDGDEETHSKYRGGNFKQTCDNAINILKLFPTASVRMTYTPENVNMLSTNVTFLHQKLGFVKIMHHSVIEADWSKDSLMEYYRQLELLYGYNQHCIKNNIPLEIAFIDKPFHILGKESRIESDFCGAGKTYIALLNNGDVYPCHRAASSRIFKLGNIFEEVPLVRGMFLSIDKEVSGKCRACPAKSSCHACIVTNYKVKGALSTPIENQCSICKIELELAQKYYTQQSIDKANRNIALFNRDLKETNDKLDSLFELISKIFLLVKGEEKNDISSRKV